MRLLRTAELDELRDLCRRGEFFWLDLHDPSRGELETVSEILHLHPLALEDTQEFGQRPKVDDYENQLLLVYFGAASGEDGPVPVEVHLHISGSFVITVHRDHCAEFDRVQASLERTPAKNETALVYRVIDALTDSLIDVLDGVAAQIDEYETIVFRRPRARDRDRMALLRRTLGGLRRVLVVQRQIFERAIERIDALPGLEQDLTDYWRDVGDHLWRALDEIEVARDSLQGMLDTYANEVQERLTIVATIFLPLTVITGFFGQNFTWMINHIGSAWAFWGLGVGGLLVSIATIVGWLMRSGLSQGPRRNRRA
jgi:magnesium transporter